MNDRSRIGYRVATLGVAWLLATLAFAALLHLLNRAPLPAPLIYASLTIGAVLGWWGFYWADSHRAREGGEFLLRVRERLGRRSSDVVAVVESAPVSVVEDRHAVTATTPVSAPASVLIPPTEASD